MHGVQALAFSTYQTMSKSFIPWRFNRFTDCILVPLSFPWPSCNTQSQPWMNLRLEHLEACSMIRTGVDCPAVLATMPRGIPSQQLGNCKFPNVPNKKMIIKEENVIFQAEFKDWLNIGTRLSLSNSIFVSLKVMFMLS